MRKLFLSAFIGILTGCLQTLAQSNASSGEIKGTVTDASGGLVPGGTVTVTNSNTGFSRTAITDERGEYRILLLPPGSYEVRVELAAFGTQVRNAQVIVGQTLAIDFRLQVGTAAQTVTVSAESPVIETERVTQSNTIEEGYIRNLPIDRRDYLSFTLLAPGVVDSNALADNTDFRVTQSPQSGLSFYGSNGRGNSVTVDGAEANDAGGGVRPTMSQEAVQEFQINRSNYAAEFGGASGGVINIVSKSGSNDFHGRLFAFMRDDKLDAGDPFAIVLTGNTPQRIKPPSERQQYGGTLGFPIRKDRTFFFGGFEGLNRNESSAVPVLTDLSIFQPTPAQSAVLGSLSSNTSTTPDACLPAVPAAAMLPPATCAAALRGALTSKQSTVELFEANSGVFPFTSNRKAFSTRIDHSASTSNQLFLRYNYTNSDEGNQSTRALLGFSRSNNAHVLDSNAVAGWTHIASSSLVNEARFQWNYRNYSVRPNELNGPEFNVTGFGFFNRDIFLPSVNTERRYEAADNLVLSRGAHRFKFGSVVLIRGTKIDSQTFFSGRFGFGTLPATLVSQFSVDRPRNPLSPSRPSRHSI